MLKPYPTNYFPPCTGIYKRGKLEIGLEANILPPSHFIFNYYFYVGEIKAHKNIENHQYLMLLTIAVQIDLVTLHMKIGPYNICM